MLNNFIFSINIAMPIFLVICAGYLMKRKGILGDSFVKASNTMIFYIALPIKIFDDLLKVSLKSFLILSLFYLLYWGSLPTVFWLG